MPSSPNAPVAGTPGADTAYAQRLGALLRHHRRSGHMSMRSVAARTGRSLSPRDLRAYERGERTLDPDVVQRLCSAYGVPFASVLPERDAVIIDLGRGQLRVGDLSVDLPDSDDPSPALRRYVNLVNKLRSRPMRNPAALRHEDTQALAEAFELDVDEVTDLLAELIGEDANARRRLLGLRSSTGTLAAVVVLGVASSALPSEATGASDSPGDDTVLDETNIDAPGGPVVIERDDWDAEHGDDTDDDTDVLGSSLDASASDDDPANAPIVDETNIDAPGGPVVIERDDWDAEQRP